MSSDFLNCCKILHVNKCYNIQVFTLLGKLQVACVLSRNQHCRDDSQIQSFLQDLKRETFEVKHSKDNKFFTNHIALIDIMDIKFWFKYCCINIS